MNKLILLAVLITVALASCKKDDAIKTSCKIITAIQVPAGLSSTYSFTYNSEGKLSTIKDDKLTSVIVYGGNTIVVNTTSAGGFFHSKKIITLNTNGFASNCKTENDLTGDKWENDTFEYNGAELIKATSTTSDGGVPYIETYTWSGGNIVSITSGSTISTLEYFKDKPSQDGDILNFNQLTAGYNIVKVKNILKSVSAGSEITNFEYKFDADGKIASFVGIGSSTYTQTYQYQCE
jgi:hypothetical protein